MVAFLGYALWVTLKHLLQRRSAVVPQPSVRGVNNAQPLSPMKVLALLSTLQSADIVLPTMDGREIPAATDYRTDSRTEIPAAPARPQPAGTAEISFKM